MPLPQPHPGFGAFGKVHREFFDSLSADGWRPVPGYEGVEEKTLSGRLDPATKTGCVTRLSRWRPGAAAPHELTHDWCEEVYVISGVLRFGTQAAKADSVPLPAGSYAVRPPHMLHGPFFSDEGCLLIEFHYYPPQS